MKTQTKTGHVLIVDSYQTTNTILEMSIRYFCPRCQITAASNSLDALHALQNEDVQIVMADFDLPGTGGGELVGKIRKSWPSVRVIAMSGLVDDWQTHPVLTDLRIDGFLKRPFGLQRLEHLLETSL